jgi:hypothetical protein
VFKPWVGDLYGRSTHFDGRRILVLGESHHSEEHPVGSLVPELTQEVMEFYSRTQKRGEWMRTLDNVAWALSGQTKVELAQEDHRGEFTVWRSVAFYNYIPVVLAKSARGNRPNWQHFQQAVLPFEAVLRDLKPHILIVCGYELFPRVLAAHWPTTLPSPWDFKSLYVDVATPSRMRVIRMLHPSAGFSHKSWHSALSQAISIFPSDVT